MRDFVLALLSYSDFNYICFLINPKYISKSIFEETGITFIRELSLQLNPKQLNCCCDFNGIPKSKSFYFANLNGTSSPVSSSTNQNPL